MLENAVVGTTDGWLNLGIPGAALLIVLIVIVLIFNQQSKSVNKLCEKIDVLVTSFSDNSVELNNVLINNDRDQKELIRQLDGMQDELKDIHKRIVRIDVRLYDQMKKLGGKDETLHTTSNAE